MGRAELELGPWSEALGSAGGDAVVVSWQATEAAVERRATAVNLVKCILAGG